METGKYSIFSTAHKNAGLDVARFRIVSKNLSFYVDIYTVQAKRGHDHNMAIVKMHSEKYYDSKLICNVTMILVINFVTVIAKQKKRNQQ